MKLSICMMVKNEEINLERCLQSLQSIRDAVKSELIIVDTGSDDKTVEIAKQFTEKIYYHPWENDFSAMRNISIGYGTGEWIFIMDADEKLENCQPLIDFLQSSQQKQYGAIAITGKNIINDDDPDSYSSMVGFRLFKNDGYFHYEGAVHNQAKFKGEALAMPEVYVLHYGYISNDKELMDRKFLRTSTILKEELDKDPKNIYYWTQLSVTYAMHKDYTEAIESVEKAYSLLPKKKKPNFMFVLLHMILVYQHEEKYERVAEVCREAISIKDGYLDVYYYYAESQAVLKNYQEAIIYYEKYLDLLKRREELDERDVTIIEYTLGCQQVVYSNLLRLYKQENKYEKALFCAEQLTDINFIKNNMPNIIYIFLALKQYSGLHKYYNMQIATEYRTVFFDQLVKTLEQFDKIAELETSMQFHDVNHDYGLLCTLIVDDHNGYISSQTKDAMAKISLENLPIYCSDIVYYILKWQYPLEQILVSFKEIWLVCALDAVNKRHDDLCKFIYCYIQKHNFNSSIHECKLEKALARCAVLLNKLNIDQNRELFERYVQKGIEYLQMIYNQAILDYSLIYDVKNDEEIFLLYMHQAHLNKEINQAEYIKYLRKALEVLPSMKNGIEILFDELQAKKHSEEQEFEEYKNKIKKTICTLIENNELEQAKSIVAEYKSIVSSDIEIVLLESQLMVKLTGNNSLLIS